MSHDINIDTKDSQLLAKGVALFNHQQYWHAHEAWEQVWLKAGEPEATFYKGLIQTAAALVHWQRGNLRGLHLNWRKARPHLVAIADRIQVIHINELITTMDHFVEVEGVGATIPQLGQNTNST